MLNKNLNLNLALKNIRMRPQRNFCIILSLLIFAFLLFAGSVLLTGLSNGSQSMADRLGADIMLVPSGYDPHIDSILLSGKPSTFYLPEDALNKLNEINSNPDIDIGIGAVSPQTFLATLNASCCSYPVQLIGIDYNSDFIVKPWLESAIHRELNDGEIITGYHVSGQPGEILKFFNKDLLIAGRLEQTGMGFDSAIFMNKNTIAVLAKEAERITGRKISNKSGMTSVIMLKLKPGYDSVVSAGELNRQLNKHGIYALFSKKFVNKISDSLSIISSIIKFILIIVWLFAVIIIALLFTLSLSERKGEMGILRVLGASRNKLTSLILTESLLTSFYGAILGAILAAAAVFALRPYIINSLKMPFLLPDIFNLILLFISAILISVLTGAAASGYAAFKAGRDDIYNAAKNF
ncbi:MAG: ABC transporter permease [Synergistaceae bacterium]|nr:ABC transporter permease [Synergistaceae bacterium]MBQ6740581.1 ABC transporter permease [Synergistaceae bacterium]MBQ7570572.1 ABC transporter permease [Synergistaceae bacterium]MBQ9582271.1 ABC transporter permease [Synergistaceae bacterium]MBQ9897122.1 ABC transporter permease [Synergistaceae bacterium]